MAVRLKISVLLLAGLTGLFGMNTWATQSSACARSAGDMSRSCRLETGEEYNVTIANCRQFATRAERIACRAVAREERAEAHETCGDQYEARIEACDLLGENRYSDPLENPAIDFIDPNDIGAGGLPNNPYVILQSGHTHVLKSEEEIVVVHATEDTRDILGVSCRVIVDIVVEEEFDDEENEWDYLPIEVTDDWFAQDIHSNVYYCGEVAQNFEEEVLRDLDGSFEAGRDYAKGGLLTLAMPDPGQVHRQEYSLGEAEDIVEYLDIAASPAAEEGGENQAYPCGHSCLRTFDSAPLDPEATEYKYYLPGIGFVLAVGLEDGELTGEREELVCVGDSLDVLEERACGIEDPEELLEELCELSDAFCEDD